MTKFLSVQEAADFLGVSPQTLRRWEANEKILPPERTQGGQRRYDITKLQLTRPVPMPLQERPTVAYARVSSHDQKEDLQRQEHMLQRCEWIKAIASSN